VNVDGPVRPASHAPLVVQLGLAPELGALALLEAALEVTGAALAAPQPELLQSREPSTDAAGVAASIIDQARTLVGLLHRYRIALVNDTEPGDPLPF
jgi:hypothetical protein